MPAKTIMKLFYFSEGERENFLQMCLKMAFKVLQFLMELVETDRTCTIDKLASLSFLNRLLLNDLSNDMKLNCASSEFTATLLSLVESGLCEHGDPGQVVLVSTAMETLYQFSQLPVSAIPGIMSKSALQILLSYIDLSGSFYTFPRTTRQIVSTVCENKHLVGKVKVVSVSAETLDYIHRHTNNELQRFLLLPIHLCL